MLGKDAHQVVFQREIKAALAGIALAAGAAAQLVVDAPRLMAFGAEDEQPARGDDLLVIGARGIGMHLVDLSPLGLGDLELLALVIEALKARPAPWD